MYALSYPYNKKPKANFAVFIDIADDKSKVSVFIEKIQRVFTDDFEFTFSASNELHSLIN